MKAKNWMFLCLGFTIYHIIVTMFIFISLQVSGKTNPLAFISTYEKLFNQNIMAGLIAIPFMTYLIIRARKERD